MSPIHLSCERGGREARGARTKYTGRGTQVGGRRGLRGHTRRDEVLGKEREGEAGALEGGAGGMLQGATGEV